MTCGTEACGTEVVGPGSAGTHGDGRDGWLRRITGPVGEPAARRGRGSVHRDVRRLGRYRGQGRLAASRRTISGGEFPGFGWQRSLPGGPGAGTPDPGGGGGAAGATRTRSDLDRRAA